MKLKLLSIFLIFVNFVHAQMPIDSGLVAYYPFDGNTLDLTAHNNHAVSFDPPILTEDIEKEPNKAYYFNGLSNYLEIADTHQNKLENDDEFAISLWINPDSAQVNVKGDVNDILSKWNVSTSTGYPYAIRLYNRTHQFPGLIWAGRFDSFDTGCSRFPSIESRSTVIDSNWYHIVFQKNENQLELYINSYLQGTAIDSTLCSIENSSSIVLGKRTLAHGYATLRPYRGAIDELRMYNRSLTQEEINVLCKQQISSTSEVNKFQNVSIYPNPLTEDRSFQLTNLAPEQIEQVYLHSVNGTIVNRLSQFQVPKHLASGIYYLVIYLKGSSVPIRKKILIL